MTINSTGTDSWEYRYERDGRARLMVATIAQGWVQVVDGPEAPAARRHEEMGGRQRYDEFLRKPAPWTREFPEFASFLKKVVTSRA